MNVGKVGAILFRTSTSDQLEISPETQVKESLVLAEQVGYSIPSEHIIGCDWASETFWDSPTMDRLKDLVRAGAISGIFQYDADRGPSKPIHRLLYGLCARSTGYVSFAATVKSQLAKWARSWSSCPHGPKKSRSTALSGAPEMA